MPAIPRFGRLALQWTLLALAALPLPAQTFVDVSAAAGLTPYSTGEGTMGHGAAAGDYDGDGFVDVFLPTSDHTEDRLYRNLGDGTFEEIAAAVGVASTRIHRSALWFDYDGDGDLDLLVAGDCSQRLCAPGHSALTLYRQNAGGDFTDVTMAAGLFENAFELLEIAHRSGLAAGDLDNDGDLDLYTGMWGPEDGRLLFNQGDGTFAEPESGNYLELPSDYDWQTVMHDFNGDGWLDIFTAVDFEPNRLWLNQQDGTFVDVAASAGVASAFNEMGVTIGDCDNDGDFDLYVTNIYERNKHNLLLRNEWAPGDDCYATAALDPCFDEISAELGIGDTYWGWGTTFIDGDNEGLLDIAATNGFIYFPWTADSSVYFVNQGGPSLSFTESSAAVGVDDTNWGSSLLALDYDRDGDLDLLQTTIGNPTPLRLRQNQLHSAASVGGHYLNVQPRSTGGNSHAIGAVIRARTGALRQSRLITAGTSLLGQEPAEAFFGLDTAATVDELTIEWPDGVTSRFDAVAGDRLLTVRRGTPSDLAVSIDDGVAETAVAPAQLTYAIEIVNLGTGDVTGAAIAGIAPAGLDCSWQCSVIAGSCAAGIVVGDIADEVNLLAGGSVSYTVDCAVGPGAPGLLESTVAVTLPGESTDPALGNNTASDTTVVLELGGCGASEHRYLVDHYVGGTETVTACATILVGSGVEVAAGGELILRAPVVGLGSGVSVEGDLAVELP